MRDPMDVDGVASGEGGGGVAGPTGEEVGSAAGAGWVDVDGTPTRGVSDGLDSLEGRLGEVEASAALAVAPAWLLPRGAGSDW